MPRQPDHDGRAVVLFDKGCNGFFALEQLFLSRHSRRLRHDQRSAAGPAPVRLRMCEAVPQILLPRHEGLRQPKSSGGHGAFENRPLRWRQLLIARHRAQARGRSSHRV